MLAISASESDLTPSRSTGLFQTLSAGNMAQLGASGRKGAEAAPTGATRLKETNKAKPSASGVARLRLDEHTAFIASILAQTPQRATRTGAPWRAVRSAGASGELQQ